tara:strand:+ start:2401 stop:3015 length:615 start_codon:yes stop_codon:yes gene_type:complete
MRTSSEIETISKRAAKAAGFPWGIAEEVGKNTKNLELLSMPGIENLNLYLQSVKGKLTEGPKEILYENKLEAKSYCPFYTGSAILDSANKIQEMKQLSFFSVNFPILIIPFLNRLSQKLGKKISLRIDEYNFLLNLNKFISCDKDLRNVVLKTADVIEIQILENEDPFQTDVWDQLYELSCETFVEETDRLKDTSAGAGLTDND